MAGVRLAVLIDGDNFGPELADLLFRDVNEIGAATIKRVYGDASHISGWRQKAREHGVALRELTPGRNAADIALVVDAMDIVHQAKVDGFCIASSDSDFAVLAARLREDGLSVRGFGEKKAKEEFRAACDSFTVLKLPKAPPVTSDAGGVSNDNAKRSGSTPPKDVAENLVKKVVAYAEGRASVSLSDLGKHLGKGKSGEGKLKTRLKKAGIKVDDRGMVEVPRRVAA